MTIKRKQYSAQFKFKVALTAIKEEKTLSQLASEYGVHPGQISQWKRQLLSEGVEVFGRNGSHQSQAQDAVQAELYEQIGRLKMELEWLKKSYPVQYCATFYLVPAQETSQNLHLMRLIDEQYLVTPFYGSRKMTVYLRQTTLHLNLFRHFCGRDIGASHSLSVELSSV